MRKWQELAFAKWSDNNYQGIFSVVTGGGKTIFAIYCLSYLLKSKLIEKVYVIVPTKALQDQWASNFIHHTSCSSGEINFKWKDQNKVNILTNLSAQKIPSESWYLKSALVLDECHRYGTEKNLSFLKIPFTSKIGLTATLERKYDLGVESILTPNIGSVVYKYDIKSALDDNVVEKYKMIYLKTSFTEQEKKDYDKISLKIKRRFATIYKEEDSFNNLSHDKVLKLLLIKRSKIVNESNQRAYVATKLILDNISRKKIIFCESIKQAEDIQELCRLNGLDTAIYHSKMPQKRRLSVLNDFQSNYFHTLIGCKALDEGFDVPDIDFGIIVSQTKTNRQRIQRLGRTIRKASNKFQPIIYTLYTTHEEFSELYKEQFDYPYIETEWLEIT